MFPTAHFSFPLQRFSGKCCVQVYWTKRPTNAQMFLTFIFENDVNVTSKKLKEKKFFVDILKVTNEIAGFGSASESGFFW
jgi:hypothetical protein